MYLSCVRGLRLQKQNPRVSATCIVMHLRGLLYFVICVMYLSWGILVTESYSNLQQKKEQYCCRYKRIRLFNVCTTIHWEVSRVHPCLCLNIKCFQVIRNMGKYRLRVLIVTMYNTWTVLELTRTRYYCVSI